MIVAIVPAAGLSRRMGGPKLVLDIHGRPLIQRVIEALREGGADTVVVVAPPIEQDGAVRIADLAIQSGAEICSLLIPTPDMRATLEAGLSYIAIRDRLGTNSLNPLCDPSHPLIRLPLGILIAPGDSVGISSGLVAAIVERFRSDPTRIVLPVKNGRRGHPLALPWTIALAIRDLPPNVGVNALLSAYETRVDRLQVDFPDLDADLDTPQDYRLWSGR